MINTSAASYTSGEQPEKICAENGVVMGNSCSHVHDPCIALQLRKPTCNYQRCGNSLPLINEESADEYPECQSTYFLNQKENRTSPNSGFETLSAINPGFPPAFPFQASDSSEMLQPSLIGLLSHKAASSPLAITDGIAMVHTHAENGRSQQTDPRSLKKPCAQLELYIVTWNMNGRVSLTRDLEIMLMVCP